ncbi:hypothetical protein SLA2020_206130 [Shorea laevis]
MERDPSRHRSSYFSGCLMSPPCYPVNEERRYSRINHYKDDNDDYVAADNKGGRWWRNLLRWLVRGGKSLYRSRPLSLNYDAVSYAQNFDDGCHHEEHLRIPREFRDP